MGFRIIPTATFERALARFDNHIAKRIVAKISELEENTAHVIPLSFRPKGLEGLYKFKVGEWRVFLTVNESKGEIVLYSVKHRKDAYRNL
ncbi:MAG: hypothetical protein COV91_01105 [Candidatus Taylorbacteria bacterium CG11_big_fil_rev_8_21_14_0_20_46_11]|uniref:Type II toxin-antitoxin system RelE/ParE family toxin n=1 Tax=Candidatus Taylorbacteria bacterium CG11_big_fil_rev_8_21_14_0_20_46_11 TaxID=1975025 RepID=A0A2H0KCI7_9BACT|nr:MAG: hypothetical protein COV91_01105 [Candidatus Taylorbacteria bacterium CG11_big_fil_rev_8_21_14_0_20_46_11]